MPGGIDNVAETLARLRVVSAAGVVAKREAAVTEALIAANIGADANKKDSLSPAAIASLAAAADARDLAEIGRAVSAVKEVDVNKKVKGRKIPKLGPKESGGVELQTEAWSSSGGVGWSDSKLGGK